MLKAYPEGEGAAPLQEHSLQNTSPDHRESERPDHHMFGRTLYDVYLFLSLDYWARWAAAIVTVRSYDSQGMQRKKNRNNLAQFKHNLPSSCPFERDPYERMSRKRYKGAWWPGSQTCVCNTFDVIALLSSRSSLNTLHSTEVRRYMFLTKGGNTIAARTAQKSKPSPIVPAIRKNIPYSTKRPGFPSLTFDLSIYRIHPPRHACYKASNTETNELHCECLGRWRFCYWRMEINFWLTFYPSQIELVCWWWRALHKGCTGQVCPGVINHLILMCVQALNIALMVSSALPDTSPCVARCSTFATCSALVTPSPRPPWIFPTAPGLPN